MIWQRIGHGWPAALTESSLEANYCFLVLSVFPSAVADVNGSAFEIDFVFDAGVMMRAKTRITPAATAIAAVCQERLRSTVDAVDKLLGSPGQAGNVLGTSD